MITVTSVNSLYGHFGRIILKMKMNILPALKPIKDSQITKGGFPFWI